MSNDFEVRRELDDFESDRPDPEEPSTWQSVEVRPDAEVDAFDWTDQHSVVADLLSDEDGPDSESTALSVELGTP